MSALDTGRLARAFCAAMLMVVSLVIPAPVRAASPAPPAAVYDASKHELYGEGLGRDQLDRAFADMVPGDVRSLEFDVRAEHLSGTATFYLASNFGEEARELLKGMKIHVDVDGARVTDGTVGERDALEQGVKLASLSGSGSARVRITVEMPASAGNETMGRAIPLDWLLTVEEDGEGGGATSGDGTGGGVEGPSATSSLATLLPKTGDGSSVPIVVAGVLGVVVLSMGVAITRLPKRGRTHA